MFGKLPFSSASQEEVPCHVEVALLHRDDEQCVNGTGTSSSHRSDMTSRTFHLSEPWAPVEKYDNPPIFCALVLNCNSAAAANCIYPDRLSTFNSKREASALLNLAATAVKHFEPFSHLRRSYQLSDALTTIPKLAVQVSQ